VVADDRKDFAVGGENWLIPVDATIANNADAQAKAISLHAVMQLVNHATTLGLVILDACRDNPFRGRGHRNQQRVHFIICPRSSPPAFAERCSPSLARRPW